MLFRRIVFGSLFVGLIAGVLLSFSQLSFVNPIIFSAESHEVGHDHSVHDHSAHGHSVEAWAPENGMERTFYTLLANIFAGIGFAAVLLSLMSQLSIFGIAKLNVRKGLLWGLGGFTAVFVFPAIGLPPEIPGVNAAPVEYRQIWWALTVLCTTASLLLLAYGELKLKVAAVFLAICPYAFYIPDYEGMLFSHPDPAVVDALTSLHQQFLYASGASNFIFWIALGIVSSWVLNRWVLRDVVLNANT